MTASTPSPCQLPLYQIIKDGKVRLIKDWNIQDRCVPRGFESDLGSVPKLFWWVVQPNDITFASILHDYDWLEADFGRYSYKLGNKSFIRNALELDKIPNHKGYLCYGVLEVVRLYKWVRFKCLRSRLLSTLN
jgi:hypothetical protein